MSVASFVAAMAPYAAQEASATGLDCRLFLTQWGLESGWGTSNIAVHDHNFAGIEKSSGKGCTCCDGVFSICPSAADFRALYDAILHNGLYGGVLAARGSSLANQFVALGASPWDAGHYRGGCGSNGCALAQLYSVNAAILNAAGCSTSNPPPPPPPPPPAGSAASSLAVLGLALGGLFAWEHRGTLNARLDLASSGGYRDARPGAAAHRATRYRRLRASTRELAAERNALLRQGLGYSG